MSVDSTAQTVSQPTNPYTRAWIIATLLLTPVTALVLAEFGLIPLDRVSALVDGFIVALVYVGFRVGYRHFALRSRATAKPEE